jgi:hypothetical protein
MKKLSIDVVAIVANYLILVYGSTTTLDVKDNLRNLGFKANQEEVSSFLAEYQEAFEAQNFVFESDEKDFTLVYEVIAQGRKSFRRYSFEEVVEDVVDGTDLDPKTYIAAHMNDNSADLATKLGISKGSVIAYKSNITMGR